MFGVTSSTSGLLCVVTVNTLFRARARWPSRRLRLAYGAAAATSFGVLPFLAGWAMPPMVAVASLAALPLLLWGVLTYTRCESLDASVYAMVVVMVVQALAWLMNRPLL